MKISKREYCVRLITCDFEKYLLEHIYDDDYKYWDSEAFALDYANRNYPFLSESEKNEFCFLICAIADVMLYKRHLQNIFSHYEGKRYSLCESVLE